MIALSYSLRVIADSRHSSIPNAHSRVSKIFFKWIYTCNGKAWEEKRPREEGLNGLSLKYARTWRQGALHFLMNYSWNHVQALCPCLWSKALPRELMIRKREDAKQRLGVGLGIWQQFRLILPHSRITELLVSWKIQIKAWHTFLSWFYRKQTPPDGNCWLQEHRL